jgi:hypothetical protein
MAQVNTTLYLLIFVLLVFTLRKMIAKSLSESGENIGFPQLLFAAAHSYHYFISACNLFAFALVVQSPSVSLTLLHLYFPDTRY